MLALVMASMMVATSEPAPQQIASLKGEPTRYCREMGSAASRSQAIMICRTRAQWQRREACVGATRYCPRTNRVALEGRETAFALTEDSRIICRRLKLTGTRLASQNACLPKREWDRLHDNSREEVSDLQDKYSKQPRNE